MKTKRADGQASSFSPHFPRRDHPLDHRPSLAFFMEAGERFLTRALLGALGQLNHLILARAVEQVLCPTSRPLLAPCAEVRGKAGMEGVSDLLRVTQIGSDRGGI